MVKLFTEVHQVPLKHLTQSVTKFSGFSLASIYHRAFYLLYNCKIKARVPAAKPNLCSQRGPAEERGWERWLRVLGEMWGQRRRWLLLGREPVGLEWKYVRAQQTLPLRRYLALFGLQNQEA